MSRISKIVIIKIQDGVRFPWETLKPCSIHLQSDLITPVGEHSLAYIGKPLVDGTLKKKQLTYSMCKFGCA